MHICSCQIRKGRLCRREKERLLWEEMKPMACSNGKTLSYQAALSIRGLSAIEIMLGHIGAATGLTILYPHWKAGILFVGIFFLLSGYGLSESINSNKNYLHHFLIKRMVSILIPAYLVHLLSGIIVLFRLKQISLLMIVKYILWADFFSGTNWYVFEILILYIVFYLNCRFLKEVKTATVVIMVGACIFVVMAFFCRINNPWYGSTLCFPLGMMYAQYEEEWNQYLRRKYWLKNAGLLLICMICIILFFILGNQSVLGNPVARNMASTSFSIWVLSVIQKMKIDYKAFRWLGEISYEIFLLHPVCIAVLDDFNLNPYVYTVVCVASSVVMAKVIHIPCKWVVGKARKALE